MSDFGKGYKSDRYCLTITRCNKRVTPCSVFLLPHYCICKATSSVYNCFAAIMLALVFLCGSDHGLDFTRGGDESRINLFLDSRTFDEAAFRSRIIITVQCTTCVSVIANGKWRIPQKLAQSWRPILISYNEIFEWQFLNSGSFGRALLRTSSKCRCFWAQFSSF